MDAFVIEQTMLYLFISEQNVSSMKNMLFFLKLFLVINFNSARKNAMDIKDEKKNSN